VPESEPKLNFLLLATLHTCVEGQSESEKQVISDGAALGEIVGMAVGALMGMAVGALVGMAVGALVGRVVGALVGRVVGLVVLAETETADTAAVLMEPMPPMSLRRRDWRSRRRRSSEEETSMSVVSTVAKSEAHLAPASVRMAVSRLEGKSALPTVVSS